MAITAKKTVTSANSAFILNCPALGIPAHILQGAAPDDFFSAMDVTSVQSYVGVDGFVSFAWVPTVKAMTVSLMANSPSYDFFEQLCQAQETSREVILIQSGIVAFPSLGKMYKFEDGAVTKTKPVPAAKQYIQPTTFEITWSRIVSSILSI